MISVIAHYLKVFFYFIPVISWKLSGKSVFVFLKNITKLWWFVLSRKTLVKNKPLDISFCHKEKKFVLNLHQPMDISALAEVFVLNEYEWNLQSKIVNILDLGAHWGDSSIYYATKYPEAIVFSVEPSEQSFSRLKQHSKQFSNLRPIQASLGAEDGVQKMFVSENSLGNSVTQRGENDKAEKIQSLTFPSLLRRCGVKKFDLVKFDIEGAEKFLFQDREILRLSDAFIGELHFDLMDLKISDIKAYFKDFTVELTKLSENRYIVKANNLN